MNVNHHQAKRDRSYFEWGDKMQIVRKGNGDIAMTETELVDFFGVTWRKLNYRLQLLIKVSFLHPEEKDAGEEEVFRHLHGDGAAAGLDVAGLDQLCGRAHQAAGVDAIVVEEIVVLGRQKCLNELWRNLREADRGAAHFAKFRDQLAVAAEHLEGDLQLDASERIDRRQVGAKIQKRAAHTEYERADGCDGRPPEELKQTYQGFSVSRL